jgi:hypothetical protein
MALDHAPPTAGASAQTLAIQRRSTDLSNDESLAWSENLLVEKIDCRGRRHCSDRDRRIETVKLFALFTESGEKGRKKYRI